MNWFLYAIGLRHEKVKSQKKICNNFCFKDTDSLNSSGVVYKFQYRLCKESYYGEYVIKLVARNCGASL